MLDAIRRLTSAYRISARRLQVADERAGSPPQIEPDFDQEPSLFQSLGQGQTNESRANDYDRFCAGGRGSGVRHACDESKKSRQDDWSAIK